MADIPTLVSESGVLLRREARRLADEFEASAVAYAASGTIDAPTLANMQAKAERMRVLGDTVKTQYEAVVLAPTPEYAELVSAREEIIAINRSRTVHADGPFYLQQ